VRERDGDFGEFNTAIYDPRTTNCGNGPCTRQPFPNATNNNTTNKVDLNLSDRHRFYAMYSHGSKKMTTPYSLSVMPLPYGDCRLIYEIMTTAQARHTWVVSPTVVNQISYGFARFWVPIQNTTIDGKYPIHAGLKGWREPRPRPGVAVRARRLGGGLG